MSDPKRPKRPIFGDRSQSKEQSPFGSRPRPGDPNYTAPTTPYPSRGEPEPEAEPEAEPKARSEQAQPAPAPGPFDELLGGDADPAALSWGELLSDVDGRPPPSASSSPLPQAVRKQGFKLPAFSLPGFSGRRTARQRPRREIPHQSYVGEEEEAGPTEVTINFRVLLRSMFLIILAGGLAATLVTWLTPSDILPPGSSEQLAIALATQAGQIQPGVVPTSDPSVTVGIVSGHKGIHPDSGLPDPGAVCADGLTEQSVVEKVSIQVAQLLESAGYRVDVLDEWDKRLPGYRALAMVSIHADSCEYVNDAATGFKVASFDRSTAPEADKRLVDCLIDRYHHTTNMPTHPAITYDMTDYHNFREVALGTPGAIIEVGFMYLDRTVLTTGSGLVAQGVAEGILCFLRNEPLSAEVTPSATP
jgi:N-acetylmuramoyl-L-alanine amidase